MHQLTMLPAIDLYPIQGFQSLECKVKNKMDIILEEATNFQPLFNSIFLLVPESRITLSDIPPQQVENAQKRLDNPQNRRERIKQFLESKPDSGQLQYLIRADNEFIGFASIDTGWDPLEMDYVDPYVQLALLHPQYNQYGGIVKQQLQELLQEIKEKRDHY